MRLDAVWNAPFASPAAHIAAEFHWLDTRLTASLHRLREEGRFDESALRGLHLAEGQVMAGLASARPVAPSHPDRLRDIIDLRAAEGELPPLYRIAATFGLTEFERLALFVAAAPALDRR